MDPWQVTIDARRSLLETFQSIDGDDWNVESLCDGWTIRDVLAHLILAAQPPIRRYLAATVRARADFDKANRQLAIDDAKRPVEELLERFRAAADHRFSPPGWPSAAPLADVLLHRLDVHIPLGIETDERPAHYEPALELLFTRAGRSFTSTRRPDVRWVATDHDWSHGSGPSVHGTMQDLALAASGRVVHLDRLDGDGTVVVREWCD